MLDKKIRKIIKNLFFINLQNSYKVKKLKAIIGDQTDKIKGILQFDLRLMISL